MLAAPVAAAIPEVAVEKMAALPPEASVHYKTCLELMSGARLWLKSDHYSQCMASTFSDDGTEIGKRSIIEFKLGGEIEASVFFDQIRSVYTIHLPKIPSSMLIPSSREQRGIRNT